MQASGIMSSMKCVLACVVAVAACGKSEPSSKVIRDEPHHEDRGEPAVASPPLKLAVRIDGEPVTWSQDVFDRVAHREGKNNSGQARDTWSLRDMAHEMVGADARVVTVIGSTKETISTEAWADATHTPILHRTRRGGLKFRWTDAAGTWDAAKVSDVVGLEIVR